MLFFIFVEVLLLLNMLLSSFYIIRETKRNHNLIANNRSVDARICTYAHIFAQIERRKNNIYLRRSIQGLSLNRGFFSV
jgi:hypothetical protein